MEEQTESGKKTLKTWLKKIGLVGFLFFLVKGLVWLALSYVIFK